MDSPPAPHYERATHLDKRFAYGDDFAGDAWVRWVAVGHNPNGQDQRAEAACAKADDDVRDTMQVVPARATAAQTSAHQSEGATPRTDALLGKHIGDETWKLQAAYGVLTELARQLEREAAALRMERDDVRNFHDASMRDAYKLLGIDGSDGEFRYKWVGLGISRLLRECDEAVRLLKEIQQDLIDRAKMRGETSVELSGGVWSRLCAAIRARSEGENGNG